MHLKFRHFVNQRTLDEHPQHFSQIYLGMGCFWGAERLFWNTSGVFVTAVGYGGGHMDLPTYAAVCSSNTGHAELVQVIFDPSMITVAEILKIFFENHDPTQGNRQGNDVGSQYRSVIYVTSSAQLVLARAILAQFDQVLSSLAYPKITTEIEYIKQFYLAENEHQQYLAKNPHGYCGLKGLGSSCPIAQ